MSWVLKNFQRLWLLLLALGALAGVVMLWRLTVRNPAIPFLIYQQPAEWIIYPKPPDGSAVSAVEMNSVFRQTFVLGQPASRANLSVRALRRMAISINGAAVDVSRCPKENWRTICEFDVAELLHAGTNEIAVTVFNSNGPPAVWLALEAGDLKLNSGTDWEASLEGAAWRKAQLASQPPAMEKGNGLLVGQNALASLVNQLPLLLVFAAVSAVIIFGGSWYFGRRKTGNPPGAPAEKSTAPVVVVLGVIAVIWLALFLNNRSQLPNLIGFDVKPHLDYVDYIRTRHALPLANEGWEMCNPPLYYLVAAGVAAPLHAGTYSDTTIQALRFLGMLIGIVQTVFIFLCLRVLFPNRLGMQLFGLVLGGCLPAQLYSTQYVTNEAMFAMWVTVAIYFCLRIIKDERESWRLALGLGLCLGAALLTKITALVAAFFVCGALFGWLGWKRRGNPRAWLRTAGVAIVAMVLVSGWHYFRVWKHFGTPIVQDWDPASGFAWWTDPGIQVAPYYARFGSSLTHPFYSVLHSFWDGMYSTMWGDGLCGGRVDWEYRPPWNYGLMSGGYLLALVPALIILIGAAASIIRLIRNPDPISFLLVGLPCATLAALVYLNLKLPYYCVVKSFYGTFALLPVCAWGAAGWGLITNRSKVLGRILGVGLGVWALNSCATFWIRGGTPDTHAIRGLYLSSEKRGEEALRQYSTALELDSHNVAARRAFASELFSQKRIDDAGVNAVLALEDAPDDAQSHLVLGAILASQGKFEGAVKHARTAVEKSPGLAGAHKLLATWLFDLKRYDEAVAAGREGLRVQPMDEELQHLIGSAWAAQTNHAEAVKYFGYACDLGKTWAEAHDSLGASLDALDQKDSAIRQFKEAARLKPEEIRFHLHLAAVFEQQGNAPEAIKTYQDALHINPQSLPALHNLAWLLATCPDAKLRNGAAAVDLAERAGKLAEKPGAIALTSLAAAYAEVGRFNDAVAAANRAIESAGNAGEPRLAAENRNFLKLYLAGQAYHQEALRPGPSNWALKPAANH